MIDLYYWTTPNGHKLTIFLEEANLAYKIIPVNLGKKEQFAASFLRISPNNKIPAIVDHEPLDQKGPLAVFESGAILIYLADKAKKFISEEIRERYEILQWLFWQVGGLGPMAGQNHHFSHQAPEALPYAIERYRKETTRLYTVLDKHLAEREYLAAAYSIADIACYPWIVLYEKQGQDLKDFPHLSRWLSRIQERPAVKRAYALAAGINPEKPQKTEGLCPLPKKEG